MLPGPRELAEFTHKYAFGLISTKKRGLLPILQVLITLVSPYLPPFYFYLQGYHITAATVKRRASKLSG